MAVLFFYFPEREERVFKMNYIKNTAPAIIRRNSEALCTMKRIAKTLALITVIKNRSENRRSAYSAKYLAIYGTPEEQVANRERDIAKAFLYVNAICNKEVKTKRYLDANNINDIEDLAEELATFLSESFVDERGQAFFLS